MTHSALPRLFLAISLVSPLFAQAPDLHAELRSTTGSTQFQIGEVIPLAVFLSSTTPNHYLEPCVLFRDSHFGFPQCRFFNTWSFTISPDDGWVDLKKEYPSGPETFGGPTFDVPDRDLSSGPEAFSYTLTQRFRFDKPGDYRVELSLDIGLDDATTQRIAFQPPPANAHSVTVHPSILLHIVPASPEWQQQVVRDGYEAYSAPIPPNSDPPSPERQRYNKATEALCNLGTPEAARALVEFLSPQHPEIQLCLEQTPSAGAAIKEMQRLLVDPDVAVNPELFSELVRLVGREDFKSSGTHMILRPTADRERDLLLSALPQKRGDAHIPSLLTALQWPPRAAKSSHLDSGYDLPFDRPVIADVVANFDKFPWDQRYWLLADGWARVRSPLMLPIVRRLADSGDGRALLRWMELDPTSATEFTRKEIVRSVPRFSSYYLRLPEASLPDQEAQLAANFVALKQPRDLFNAATLLHRYATKAVLPTVLPAFDANRATWPLSVQYPLLAYLLKVSPDDAAPRLEQTLQDVNHQPWQTTFFSDIGFLQPSPVLDLLALAQVDSGTQPLARDALEYLRLHASPTAKPLLWTQLARWHDKLEALQSDKFAAEKAAALINDEVTLVRKLSDAYIGAQGWLLSPQDENNLRDLLGEQTVAEGRCRFLCGGTLAAGPGPGAYSIYGQSNFRPLQQLPEYMNPNGHLRYSINQYQCPDLHALEQKILQFPAGSSFDFAYNFSGADRDEMIEVYAFLQAHGYKMQNPGEWSFLPPPPKPPEIAASHAPVPATVEAKPAPPPPHIIPLQPATRPYLDWKKDFGLTDTAFGKRTALLDHSTRLAWLQLSHTAGLSYDQVREKFVTDGRFAGWRFATTAELHTFFADFTGSPTGHSSDPAIERTLQQLLGGPLNQVSNPEIGWYRRDSYGFVGDPAGPDNEMIHYHAGYLTEETGGFNIDPDSGGSFRPGVADAGWGSFLVLKQ